MIAGELTKEAAATAVDKTRVVYASLCPKCETCHGEEVREVPYATVAALHLKDLTESKGTFFVYHDVKHRALFRSLIMENCHNC